MSGNTHTPELEYLKQQKMESFKKRMSKYGLTVRSTVAVLSTSYPNTVNLCFETETYPTRGNGALMKHLKADGWWVDRWPQREKIIGPTKYLFKVRGVYLVTIHDEAGVRA